MKFNKKFSIALASLAITCSAFSQVYPVRPLKLITGTLPGGTSSIMARMFAEELAKHLGQAVVVEDKPGAENMIAAKNVMASASDGYTLFVGGINPHPLLRKDGIDVFREMEPVGIISSVPMVFVTTNTVKLDTVQAVAKYATANPNQLYFGSAGGSSYWNLMMKSFARNAGGFSFTHVPYKGASETQLALGRGDIQISMMTPLTAAPMEASGKARSLFVAAPKRLRVLPNVPTPVEAGLSPFSVSSNMYLLAPLGTPPQVIKKLNAAMLEIAKETKYIKMYEEKTGVPPMALSTEETRTHFNSDVQLLREVLRDSGTAMR